jgi:formate dehydrogenase subunit gamma
MVSPPSPSPSAAGARRPVLREHGGTDRPAPALVRRFGATERALHWAHATGFLVMLASGLILYVPALSELVARRPLVKGVHLWTAVIWAVALVAIVVGGDRRRLAADWREAETIDRDDRLWLSGRSAPQGRFNAGQKLNVIVTVAFAVLFALSGLFLWLGERDHTFLLDGAGTVHEALTLVSLVLLAGHLYLALVHPATRHALQGITTGEVRADWAAEHHAKWLDDETVP